MLAFGALLLAGCGDAELNLFAITYPEGAFTGVRGEGCWDIPRAEVSRTVAFGTLKPACEGLAAIVLEGPEGEVSCSEGYVPAGARGISSTFEVRGRECVPVFDAPIGE
jgi:hypothetical protein